jgi:hypothetical protein
MIKARALKEKKRKEKKRKEKETHVRSRACTSLPFFEM